MFGWELPEFAHLPLLLNENKSKLSKRQGDVSVEDFLNKGYLKEALINFVAFLGWNPGGGETREIYSLEELVEVFKLEKVHKSGAVVDIKKLGTINAHYIKEKDTSELYEELCTYFQNIPELAWVRERYPKASDPRSDDGTFLTRVLTVEKERLQRLIDFGVDNPFFFHKVNLDKDLLTWKDSTVKQTRESLQKALEVLQGVDEGGWTRENLATVLMDAAGDDRGGFLWPLRAALTGHKRSPSPMDCAWVLGKEESIKRLESALG